MESQELSHIFDRIGKTHASRRLELQTIHSAIRSSPTGLHVSFENFDRLGPLLKVLLKISGLWSRAVGNSLDYEIAENTVHLARLPESFQGFRILHLSDLHLEGIMDQGQSLQQTIRQLDYDLCVITGDFRLLTYGDHEQTLRCLSPLVKSIQCPHGIIGILGNHDFLEMVPGLENLGIRMLLNEAMPVQRRNESIWIVGVDDAHWYEVADLPKALHSVPHNGQVVRILLAHSPELILEAVNAGLDLYLCGHSHGGQICLPGGHPIIVNSRCERTFSRGSWEYHQMQGYTSRGVGTSLLPVRLSCRPEIVIHTLV
ncbi:MAG: metallophosphoesterase [Nitrospirales bacterium]|nr:metallophosphoesterase [Nitrospira sp.]MDR4500068.1 metallophosphoesterase [Nitrospirales bacterium]